MLQATHYEVSQGFTGVPAPAFDVARTALLALGFRVVVDEAERMSARGPGLQSNREPALLGATELTLRIRDGHIHAHAVLGGVATMKAFLTLFPPVLALFLVATFYLVGMEGPSIWYASLSVAPLMLMSPMMTRSLERKTTRAIDALVAGMAQAYARAA